MPTFVRIASLLATAAIALPAAALTPVRTTPWTQAHDRAVGAVSALQLRYPHVEADWQPHQPGVHMLLDLEVPLPGETVVQKADAFLREHAVALGIPASELKFARTVSNKERMTVRYQHKVRVGDHDVAVLDGEVALTFDVARGMLLRVVNSTQPVLDLEPATISREDAVAKATQSLAGVTFARGAANNTEEGIIAGRDRARLVWIVHVAGTTPKDLHTVGIDARTGTVTQLPSRVMD